MDNSNNNELNNDINNMELGSNDKDINNNLSLNIINEINNSQNILDINTIEKLIKEREYLNINLENEKEKENKNTKNIKKINMPYIFTGEKGGMKGIDHEKIDKIIYETTKNTTFYKKNEEDLNFIKEEVSLLEKKLENFHKNEILYNQIEQLANSRLEFLKKQRRFDKIWFHLDMDMFFAAVEIRDNPSLEDIPIAIGTMSMISTSNYIARKYGVRSAMPGFIAVKLCPQLKIIEPDYFKYKEESCKIMDILNEYDIYIESMGLDEAYIDLTDYCKIKKIYSKEEIIEIGNEIKKKIYDKTKLSCSIGIACNKTLAKICSDYNKPNGLYYLDYDCKVIEEFISKLNVRKIPYIGNKTELRLNLMKIYTCKDLIERYVDLFYLNEDSFDFYMKNCFGIGKYEHCEFQEEKSFSRSVSFFMTKDNKFLFKILDSLVEMIYKDMDKNKILYCKTVTVEIIGITERKISKSFTNKYGLPNRNKIKIKAYELFNELLEKEVKIRMIRFKISGLVRINENKNENGIFELLNNLKNDYKIGILPNKKFSFKVKFKKHFRNTIEKYIKKNNVKEVKNKMNSRRSTKYKVKRLRENKKDNIRYKDILNLFINMKNDIEQINENNY